MSGILLLDNNCLDRLSARAKRDRLRANLRAAGLAFWPSAINILEALKSRDDHVRQRLLATIADLADDHHALTLPGEALRRVAVAMTSGGHRIDWSEPKLTRLFRYPDSVTQEDAKLARQHLEAQEARFEAAHAEASQRLRSKFKEAGGRRRWSCMVEFLDEVWLSPEHLQRYVDGLWDSWDLGRPPTVELVLEHASWRLFFDAWGASVYAQHIEHPQQGHVQHSDLNQLVYFGGSNTRLLASEDRPFRRFSNNMLRGRHPMAEVASLRDFLH